MLKIKPSSTLEYFRVLVIWQFKTRPTRYSFCGSFLSTSEYECQNEETRKWVLGQVSTCWPHYYAPSSRSSKTNSNPSLMSVEGSFQTHLLTALDWCLSIISRWEKNFFVATTCLLSSSKKKILRVLMITLVMRNQNL